MYLRLKFYGLCTFVVDDAKDPGVHVLMPTTHGHHAHSRAEHGASPSGAGSATAPPAVPEHEAWLFWDPEQVQFAPVDRGAVTPAGSLGPTTVDGARAGELSLRRKALEVRPRAIKDPPPALPRVLFDLTQVTARGVPRTRIADPGGEHVLARVFLGAGGSVSAHESAFFRLYYAPGKVGREEYEMATWTEWAIEIAKPEDLEWTLIDLDTRTAVPYALGTTATTDVEMSVRHLPAAEVRLPAPMPMPDPGTPTDHFAAYYTLFTDPSEQPIPVFERPAGGTGRDRTRDVSQPVTEGVTMGTCMNTQARLD